MNMTAYIRLISTKHIANSTQHTQHTAHTAHYYAHSNIAHSIYSTHLAMRS